MAYDDNGEWVDDPVEDSGGQGYDDSSHNSFTVGENDHFPVDNGGGIDYRDHSNSGGSGPELTLNNNGGKSEESMKKDLGGLYTEGAYDEWKHRDFDPGWYDRIVKKENLRADNEVGSEYHSDGKGGYLTKAQKASNPGPSSMLLGSAHGSGGGNNGSGDGGVVGGGGGNKINDVYGYLKGLFPDGAFNKDVVNRRVDNIRGTSNSLRNSTMRNNEAYLAEHGLLGSGPQAEAANSLDSRLFGLQGQQINDAYATESENADKRMMGALTAATGLSEAEAQNYIDQFRADTDRDRAGTERDLGFGNLAARNKEGDQSYELGKGNLGLGYFRAGNDFSLGQGNLALGDRTRADNYNLGAGNLQLDREKLQQMIESGDTDAALKYLELLMNGAGQASNGYVKR